MSEISLGSSVAHLPPVKNSRSSTSNQAAANPCIWHAPEVSSEQDKPGEISSSVKCTEKADFYSFSMMSKDIVVRAGERPLFSFQPPKYLTKRCRRADPSPRPSFSTICGVLRSIKRFLVRNPDHGRVDANLPGRFPSWGGETRSLKSRKSPFQMFAYRLAERERTSVNVSVRNWNSDSGSDAASSLSLFRRRQVSDRRRLSHRLFPENS